MADEQTPTTPPTPVDGTPEAEAPSTPETWDAWMATLPADQQPVIETLYEQKTVGLQSALKAERQAHKDLEKQVRDLAKNAEKGSDTESKLTEMANSLAVESRRADFYEQAAKPETGLVEAKAAWKLANADPEAFINKRGEVDLAALKVEYPYLFRQPEQPRMPKANAGNGVGTPPPSATNMNDLIRKAAGRT